MGIYLGSTLVSLNFSLLTPISNSIKLITIDNYSIKDSNGLYLTAKKGE